MQEKDRSAFADIIQRDRGIRDLDFGCYWSSPATPRASTSTADPHKHRPEIELIAGTSSRATR